MQSEILVYICALHLGTFIFLGKLFHRYKPQFPHLKMNKTVPTPPRTIRRIKQDQLSSEHSAWRMVSAYPYHLVPILRDKSKRPGAVSLEALSFFPTPKAHCSERQLMLPTGQTTTLSKKTTRFHSKTGDMTQNSICTNSNSTASYSIQESVQLEVSISEIETFLLGLHSKPEQHIPNTKQVGTKVCGRSPRDLKTSGRSLPQDLQGLQVETMTTRMEVWVSLTHPGSPMPSTKHDTWQVLREHCCALKQRPPDLRCIPIPQNDHSIPQLQGTTFQQEERYSARAQCQETPTASPTTAGLGVHTFVL